MNAYKICFVSVLCSLVLSLSWSVFARSKTDLQDYYLLSELEEPINLRQRQFKKKKIANMIKPRRWGVSFGLSNALKYSELNGYKKYYGKAPLAPFVKSFSSLYTNTHFSLRSFLMFGYSQVSGKQFSLGQNKDLVPIEGSSLRLTQVPVSLGLSTFVKLVPTWPVDLSLSFAYQNLFYEETRVAKAGKNRDFNTTSENQVAGGSYRNKGWAHGFVLGGSFRVLMNRLGKKEVRSLKRVLGLGNVYFAIFYQQVTNMSGKAAFIGPKVTPLSFARQEVGIEFSFESI